MSLVMTCWLYTKQEKKLDDFKDVGFVIFEKAKKLSIKPYVTTLRK